MASWLKAAEDLFEVVDRRAKLVVSDLSEEQFNNQPPASNGQESQAKRAMLKAKAKKRPATNESPKRTDTILEQSNLQTSHETPDKDGGNFSVEKEGTPSDNSIARTISDTQLSTEKDASSTISPETLADEMVKHDADHVEPPMTVIDVDAAISMPNGIENASDVAVHIPSSPSLAKEIEVVTEVHPSDSSQNIKSGDADVLSTIDEENSQSLATDSPVNEKVQSNNGDKIETPVNQIKKQVHKPEPDGSPTKEQDQLEEAQGLLKTAVVIGQSKEARLARACAGLSSRLQEYKSENAQLEELLAAERELSKSYEDHIKQLQQDLSLCKKEVSKVESNMADALAAKNAEIVVLVNSMDGLKRQATLSEGNLASLQADMEYIKRNRELTETRMIQALREELASVERRAEDERAAHNATKKAAMEREVELEHRAIEASTALARTQRIADERTAKATELEQKVALLEVECASLNQELQEMEARARRGQKKSIEGASQAVQMQAWQEEVERARQGQRDAESKLSSLEAEVQKTRVEMAAMKRDAEHYSRHEHMELEKRYRELTDLLYYKQTQLEATASEKAAAEFQLDKELKRMQEAQVDAERSKASRRVSSSSWEEDTEIKALETLPMHHRHMAGARMQLQKAAKLLDSGAVRATRFLWRYPIARVTLLFYLVFVHLFLMYLLHRLQEQEDNFSAREVAESMGLATPTLP